MSLKDLADTCDLVSEAFAANHFGFPWAVAALLRDVKKRDEAAGLRFGDAAHKTEYVPCANHEMEVWGVSLILVAYLLDLLGRKVKGGHCNHPGHVPCAAMQEAHLRMLEEYRKALEQLVADAKSLEATLAGGQQAGQKGPTQP